MKKVACWVAGLTVVLAMAVCASELGTPPSSGPSAGPSAQKKGGGPDPQKAAEFFRLVMQKSQELAELDGKIKKRKAALYEENEQIKALQAQMRALQKKIDKILESDPELAELTMQRNTLRTTMPTPPKASAPMGMPGMPPLRGPGLRMPDVSAPPSLKEIEKKGD